MKWPKVLFIFHIHRAELIISWKKNQDIKKIEISARELNEEKDRTRCVKRIEWRDEKNLSGN